MLLTNYLPMKDDVICYYIRNKNSFGFLRSKKIKVF